MKSFRDIRVIPVVLIAIFSLAVLKVAGLVIDGGYVFDYQPQKTTRSWAQETLNFPGSKLDPADITGSTHEKPKEAAKPAAPAPEVAKPDGVVVYPEQTQPVSASERAILERLQSRRQELAADEFAARHADAGNLVTALVKLYRDNATTLTPDRVHSAFYDSHPPATLRIARLQQLATR
jgi:hypothetical protein